MESFYGRESDILLQQEFHEPIIFLFPGCRPRPRRRPAGAYIDPVRQRQVIKSPCRFGEDRDEEGGTRVCVCTRRTLQLPQRLPRRHGSRAGKIRHPPATRQKTDSQRHLDEQLVIYFKRTFLIDLLVAIIRSLYQQVLK